MLQAVDCRIELSSLSNMDKVMKKSNEEKSLLILELKEHILKLEREVKLPYRAVNNYPSPLFRIMPMFVPRSCVVKIVFFVFLHHDHLNQSVVFLSSGIRLECLK